MRHTLLFTSICILTVIWTLAPGPPATAQAVPGYGEHYGARMRALSRAINRHYYDSASRLYQDPFHPDKGHRYTYLWPLAGMLQAENQVNVVDSGSGGFRRVARALRPYFDKRSPAGYDAYLVSSGDKSRFYDDNEWIGLAMMDAYLRTGRRARLDQARMIYRFVASGFDEKAGGGIYWKEGDTSTKNTCSNGPGVLLALKLFAATRDSAYLRFAIRVYGWVRTKLEAPSGLYYDNIQVRTGQISRRMYAYNTGTMLEASVMLYQLSGEDRYLKEAHREARSATEYFCGGGRFRDGFWFTAVLLRGYQRLAEEDKNPAYLREFRACTDYALAHQLSSAGLMEKDGIPVDLVNQSGMLEILARLADLERITH
jgi:uncharacterized protein YyaL (SSP411 family)